MTRAVREPEPGHGAPAPATQAGGQAGAHATTAPVGRLRLPMLVLGYAGLLPFLYGAASHLWGTLPVPGTGPALFLLAYGAVILAFLGAIHWGMALAAPAATTRPGVLLIGSVAPSLVGWVALLAPLPAAYPIQALGFVAVLAADILVLRGRVPGWYLGLRAQLTAVAVLCLLGAALV